MTPLDKPGPVDPRYTVTTCLTCGEKTPGTLRACDCGRTPIDLLPALAEVDAHNAPCAVPDCPRDATGCNRCLAAENEALLSELREARAQATEAHRLAIESKRKMDAAYDHADLIQHEMTTATDDCPHPTDTWTTCSACHLKVMRERDALTKQVADLAERLATSGKA